MNRLLSRSGFVHAEDHAAEWLPCGRGSFARGPLSRVCTMFALFERLLKPAVAPDTPEPPPGLVAFYWHFARQAKPLFAALFVAGFIVAIMDTMIPIFIGRIVTLVTSANPATLFAEHGHLLLLMLLVLLLLRPLALTTQNLLANQAIA